MQLPVSQARDAGWIYELHEVPSSDDSQILPALATGPYVQLTRLQAASCPAGALVLGNCRGGRTEFLAAVARWLRRPTAVTYCFDGADHSDHSPIAIVREILGTTAGADGKEALWAVDATIYNHRATARGCEMIEPACDGTLREA